LIIPPANRRSRRLRHEIDPAKNQHDATEHARDGVGISGSRAAGRQPITSGIGTEQTCKLG
jgi:hypothetical protein